MKNKTDKQPGKRITSALLFQDDYEKAEDRITKAFLHFLYEAGYDFLRRLANELDCKLNESPMQIFTQHGLMVENDPKNRADGVVTIPSLDFIFESKINASIDMEQYVNLCTFVNTHREIVPNTFLVYITTHDERPDNLNNDTKWISWDNLYECMRSYTDEHPELKPLLVGFEGLYYNLVHNINGIPNEELTVIIPAGNTSQFVLKNHLYNCPANRDFRNAKYMAFYFDQEINHVFEISKILPRNGFTYDNIPQEDKVFELKEIADFPEIRIVNDKKSKSGKNTAFTQRHRFCSLHDLKDISKTSELEQRMQDRIKEQKIKSGKD